MSIANVLALGRPQANTGAISTQQAANYVNDCLYWYGLGIGLRVAIIARGRIPRVNMAGRRSTPRPYQYKQPLTYLLIFF